MKILLLYTIALIISLLSPSVSTAQELYKPLNDDYSKVALPALPAKLDFAGEDVPLHNFDVQEGLQRELLVTTYMHSRTYVTLLNVKRYTAIIEPIMKKNGIPMDFVYLCMAESGMNPNVISSAGAGGLWQIMPATGKQYGLVTGKEVDERYDIEKSTEVACKHLLDSYAIFGSWTLAAAAYNLGNTGVSKRLEIQGVKDYYDVFLPEETMRYLYRILSYKMLCQTPSYYGFNVGEGDQYRVLSDYHEVTVSDKAVLDWSKIAVANGTTYKMLRQLNHWIRDYTYDNKAGRAFKLKIPNNGFREKIDEGR